MAANPLTLCRCQRVRFPGAPALGWGRQRHFRRRQLRIGNGMKIVDGIQMETLRTGQDAIAYETGMGGFVA